MMRRSGQRSSTSGIKILATVVFLLVVAALLVVFVRRSGSGSSVGGSEIHHQAGATPYITIGTSKIKPERLPAPVNISDIYISVLTAPVYHNSRFAWQYLTWLQTVDPKNVRVITDSDDNEWIQAFKSEGGTVAIPTCSLSNIIKSAGMMCCKSGAQFDNWYKAKEGGHKYKWYCHIDDDLYLNAQALVDVLKHYDPTTDRYVGAWTAAGKYHKLNRIPMGHRLAPNFAAYKERKRDDFRYANGPSYCISEALMKKVEKYLRGEKFEANCRKSQVMMDDILPGMIINGVLGVDLIDTSEFRAQMDDIVLYHGSNPEAVRRRKKKDITMSFGGFVIKHGVFNFQEDPKGVLSYHCLLHPSVSWCNHHREY